MNRAPLPLIRHSAALIALAAAVPLAAQATPGGSFSLPEPTPTPTPAPAGPADEVAGVAIPPRSVAQPRIAPAPVLVPEASPSPRPAPLRPPPPRPSASPAAPPAPTASAPVPAPANTPAPLPTPEATPEPGATPGFKAFTPPAETAPAEQPSEPLGNTVLDWRWLAAGGLLLATLLGGWLLWRRRKPKVLRLAAPVAAKEEEDAEPALPRIDISVEIPGSSRSVMTFTLRYRINLANRSDRAVNDLAVAVQVTTARQGQSNAAPLAAAQNVTRVERIGPHQSRSISGEVQLPFAGIAPVMQGRTMLFIPLLHVTLEGEGQQALARSFVIGTPGATDGRVQPLRMDMLPGSAPELRARAIEAPPPA